jgi:hypothetical protein
MDLAYVYSPADEEINQPIGGHEYRFRPNTVTEIVGTTRLSAAEQVRWLLSEFGATVGYREWKPKRDGDPFKFVYDETHPVVKEAEDVHREHIRSQVIATLKKDEAERKELGPHAAAIADSKQVAWAKEKAKEWGIL